MHISWKEFWTVFHGLIFIVGYLLIFISRFVGSLWSLKPTLFPGMGLFGHMKWLSIILAVTLWITVITGTYIVYPWYRVKPSNAENLENFPKWFLLSKAEKAGWHIFGMEWKEHVGWFAPILATAIAYIVLKYRERLAKLTLLRKAVLILNLLTFFSILIGGVLGILINAMAPIR